MTIRELEGPHWAFSLRTYGEPGVSEVCVTLQDRHGVDVNVLLIALWAVCDRRIRVDASRIASLDSSVADLRASAVVPIRTVRRWMKSASFGLGIDAARDRVKKAELAVEQLEQALLAEVVRSWSGIREPGTLAASSTAQAVVSYYASKTGTESQLSLSHSEVQYVARVAARHANEPTGR